MSVIYGTLYVYLLALKRETKDDGYFGEQKLFSINICKRFVGRFVNRINKNYFCGDTKFTFL